MCAHRIPPQTMGNFASKHVTVVDE